MDLGRAVHALAQEIAAAQSFDRLACGFVNDAGDYLEIIGHPEGTSWGFGPRAARSWAAARARCCSTTSRCVQPDLLHQHRFIEDMRLLEEGVRSYVLLPLVRARAHDRRAGPGLAPSRLRSTRRALDRLQPLADAAALALENVRLLQKTRELSITDEVTPLFNFRFFHQILDRELKLVDRYKSVLSLIFLDLDRFKPINDQHGHLRGSRVLREVGFLLRAAVRETDFPARYGGDEFVVILPQTDARAPRTRWPRSCAAHRGAHVPAGGGHQRAAGRVGGRRHLSAGGRLEGGADPPGRRAHVRGQGSASSGPMSRSDEPAAAQQLDEPRPGLPRPRDGPRSVPFLGAARRLAFVPFALHDREGYTAKAAARFEQEGIAVDAR